MRSKNLLQQLLNWDSHIHFIILKSLRAQRSSLLSSVATTRVDTPWMYNHGNSQRDLRLGITFSSYQNQLKICEELWHKCVFTISFETLKALDANDNDCKIKTQCKGQPHSFSPSLPPSTILNGVKHKHSMHIMTQYHDQAENELKYFMYV